jgi:hypothetical protein
LRNRFNGFSWDRTLLVVGSIEPQRESLLATKSIRTKKTVKTLYMKGRPNQW